MTGMAMGATHSAMSQAMGGAVGSGGQNHNGS